MLADGDLLTLDVAVMRIGVASDAAISFIVGTKTHSESAAMIEATERALAPASRPHGPAGRSETSLLRSARRRRLSRPFAALPAVSRRGWLSRRSAGAYPPNS